MSGNVEEGRLPGHEIVTSGIEDLAQGKLTEFALLVLVAAPRLRRLGFQVPSRPLSASCEHLLYAMLEERLGTAAHSHYNSLLRRMASFASALEREKTRSPAP